MKVFSNLYIDISVVIPVMNEERSIILLLQGLINQTKKPKEIVIIDSGSVDGTLAQIVEFTPLLNHLNIRLTLLNNPSGFPGGNRNLGVTVALYDWIAFIDAGIVPNPNWLEALWCCMQVSRAKAIFGRCQFDGDTTFSKAVCAVSSGCGSSRSVVPASLFHRSVFIEVGYFREDLRAAEDLLWMNEVDKFYGERFICEQAVVFYNQFPTDILALTKKWSLYQNHIIRAGLLGVSTWLLFIFYIFNILLIAVSPLAALILFSFYIFLRGVIFPCVRSSKLYWWRGSANSVLIAPLVSFVIDSSKVATLFFALIYFENLRKLCKSHRSA
jgi:glycosyltransferase involved in cell wall biosynthesis